MKFSKPTVIGCAFLLSAAMTWAQEPASKPTTDPVVAHIGDEVITESELEGMVGTSLHSLRQQLYDAKVKELKSQIFNRLVGEAATAEGMTSADYLKKHVDQQIEPPTEEEILPIFNQYRERLVPDDIEAKKQVAEFLNAQRRQVQEAALIETLFAENSVQILLEPPRVQVEIGEGTPIRGSRTAPIVLVEYTDYQCPYCTRVQPTLDALMKTYGDQVVHVFKNLPLPIHSQAQLAGEASLCAQDQGKFWEYHDWLFQNQRTLSRETMIEQATQMEMNTELFTNCLEQDIYGNQVKSDMKEAHSFGINGTPGFLINGRVLSGAQPLEAFVKIIDEELKRKGLPVPKKVAAEGASEEENAEEAESGS